MEHREAFGDGHGLAVLEPERTRLLVASAHDFEVDARPVARAVDALAGVAAVGPDLLERRVLGAREFDDVRAAVAVLDVGRVNQDGAGQAACVDDQMALAPLDFLAGVVAERPPFSVVLTVWLSTIPALGSASRPSLRRQNS